MFNLIKDGLVKFWRDPDYAATRLRALWFLACQAISIAMTQGLIGGDKFPKIAIAAQLLSSLSLGISQGEKNPKPPTT